MDTNKKEHEICVLDVKELYDAAYAVKDQEDRFRAIMAEAVKLDMAYRKQLTRNKRYLTPNPDNDASTKKEGTRVA